jgi:hypothetical protein
VTAELGDFMVSESCFSPSSGSCSGLSLLRSGPSTRPKAIADKFCSNKIIHFNYRG